MPPQFWNASPCTPNPKFPLTGMIVQGREAFKEVASMRLRTRYLCTSIPPPHFDIEWGMALYR